MTAIADIFGSATDTSLAASSTTGKAGDVMGKEDFLTLLVAQLKNQDPMNPDDPTEFTAQLAQFSSLEQLFNMNESMGELTSAQQQSDRFATMDLIGKSVSYADSTFTIDDSPVSVGYELDGTAASLTMTIQDTAGAAVATLHPTELGKGRHFMEWNGLNDDGDPVPAGEYRIVLQAAAGADESTIAVSPLVQSEVTGVDFSSETGEAIIYTLAGAEINSTSILAVYKDQGTRESDSAEEQQDTNDTARKAASPEIFESASTDGDQIAQDQLQHFLAGIN